MSREKKSKEPEINLIEMINLVAKEKNIDSNILMDAIENSLTAAAKNGGKADNVKVDLNRETGEYHITAERVVTAAEDIVDKTTEISPEDAAKIDPDAKLGDTVNVKLDSKDFGRIAIQNAKNVIFQKIRDEERNSVFNEFYAKENDIVTGTVERYIGRNVAINLGRADGILNEKEMVKTEVYKTNMRIKVYIIEVKNTSKGPRILVSRTHPELVKRLFEEEVAEIQDGTVEVKSIAREAGSRTKMAVWSNNPNVDPVGACVGVNGSRVNTIVDELNGEKIDIVNWDENPGNLIQNALSPAKIVAVFADPDEKSAKVVVPDYQLSLAIGKEGQNARLAARLTGYKIDIKSETQAKDAPGFRYEDYEDDEEYDTEDEGQEQGYEDAPDSQGVPVDEQQAEELLSDIQRYLAHYNETSGKVYDVSVSIGYVIAEPSSAISIDSYVEQADACMYEAKQKFKQKH